MELNKTKNSIRNSLAGVINRCINLLMPFIIRTIIIQKLGQEYLGLNSLFTSIIHVLNLTELGIGTALVFKMYKPIVDENYSLLKSLLNVYKNVYRLIGFIVLTIGLLITPFLTHIIDMSALEGTNINVYLLFLIYLANTVFTYLFFAYRKSLFIAYQRQDIISKVDSFVHMIMFLVQILIIYLFKNYYIYILMLPVFTLLDNGVTAFLSRKKYNKIDREKNTVPVDVKGLLKDVQYLIGHRVGGVIISSADSIIISAFLPMITLTTYSNYFYVISALTGFINVGYNAISAGIGNSLITKSNEENYKLFKDLTFILFYIVSFCSICLFCLFQPFMKVWMGDVYMFSFRTVVLFSLYFYSWQIRVMGLNFKEASGMWKNDWLKPYVGMIINLLLNFILVNIIGVDGVIIATIVVMISIYFPWETVVLHRDLFKMSIASYILRHLYYLFITAVGCIVCGIVTDLICISGIIGLVIKGLIVFFLSNIIIILFSFKLDEFDHTCWRLRRFGKIKKRNE